MQTTQEILTKIIFLNTLQGYYAVGILTGTASANYMTIELVINLWNMRSNDKGFMTVCSPGFSNCDVIIPSNYIHYRNEFARNQQTMFTFMNTGNKYIHAIALLYSSKSISSQLTLSQSTPFIKIDKEIKALIQSHLVDMVVYARKAAFDNCELFLDLYADFADRKYVLREIDDDNEQIDYTLNRCAVETDGFLPEKFKLGKPTPGEQNDCTGTHFILEDHLLNVTDTLQNTGYDMDDADLNEIMEFEVETAHCSSTQTTSQYLSFQIQNINKEISRKMVGAVSDECTSLDLNPDSAKITNELNIENERKRHISDTTDYSVDFEWETTKYFE